MRHNGNQRGFRARNGSVLLAVMVVSVIVSILGTSMLTVGYHARVRATRITQDMAARVAADAGLAKAIHVLSSQFDSGTLNPLSLPSGTDVAIPHFEGTFTYTVTENSGGYTITSVGDYYGARRTVEAVLQGGGLVHEYAFFVLQNLVLGNSAKIDWYNYESGETPLQIGTSSTGTSAITLRNNSHINGDVVVGAGGDPGTVIRNQGGWYTGSAYAQWQSYEPPAVSVPAYLVAASSGGRIDNNQTIGASGKYAEINLGTNRKLIIDGHVELYITGDVILGNSAEIQVNEGGSLVLYVDGEVEGRNGSVFNNRTEDPRRFRLFGTASCTEITLNNSGDMYAIIYAPAAQLTLDNSATLHGSVTAHNCELRNNATMYYDASLREYRDPVLTGTLELVNWREY